MLKIKWNKKRLKEAHTVTNNNAALGIFSIKGTSPGLLSLKIVVSTFLCHIGEG